MKNIKTILAIGLCATVTIGGFYVNGTGGFQTDGGGYVPGFDVIGTDGTNYVDQTTSNNPRLIQTVQKTVNRVLGILGLIALILCLRGGFQMLTAAGDDAKVKTGTKVLKHAAIGLAVIGLSRILVSFIFRLINKNAVTGS